MSEEYRNGINAAANLLRVTADDYEEMAQRRERLVSGYGTRSYQQETAQLRDKAALLRGQASRIQAELTP